MAKQSLIDELAHNLEKIGYAPEGEMTLEEISFRCHEALFRCRDFSDGEELISLYSWFISNWEKISEIPAESLSLSAKTARNEENSPTSMNQEDGGHCYWFTDTLEEDDVNRIHIFEQGAKAPRKGSFSLEGDFSIHEEGRLILHLEGVARGWLSITDIDENQATDLLFLKGKFTLEYNFTPYFIHQEEKRLDVYERYYIHGLVRDKPNPDKRIASIEYGPFKGGKGGFSRLTIFQKADEELLSLLAIAALSLHERCHE